MTVLVDLAKLKEKLPFGAQGEIAKRSGIHLVHVNRVLNGKYYNEKVIATTIEYLKELKEREESYKLAIKELLNEN
jgi:predicted transcriptional regulator